MAEMKNEGIPSWVYRKHPESVPTSWDGAPSPSRALDYLHPGFLAAARSWYRAVMPLLASRLQLRAQIEQREQPIYALVVVREDGRLGPQLKKAEVECGVNGASACGIAAGPGVVIKAVGAPLSALANFFWVSAGRPVFDRTGLVGNYQFTLSYRPENGRPPNPGSPPDARPSLFTALQEQLGLKLQPDRGLVATLVVEQIERPSEN